METINTIDCGDEVGAWLDKALGEPQGTLRLLYHPMSEKHRSGLDGPAPWTDNCKPEEEVPYQSPRLHAAIWAIIALLFILLYFHASVLLSFCYTFLAWVTQPKLLDWFIYFVFPC